MKFIKLKLSKIPKELFIIFGCAFLFMSFTLFSSISWGHDYIFHVSNIFGMDQFLEPFQGKLIPSKIIPVVGYGFGYGTGLFYPPFPHVITTSIFLITKYLHFNLPQTMELMKLFVLFASGITMYYLVKRISKNNQVALISSISYMASPYFLSDIYVRCSFAEIFVFIFIPIVFRGLYELFYGKKELFYLYFIIGYVGMILSHLVITCYLTLIILFLLIFKVKTIFKERKIVPFIIASVIILGITSFFYVPMLEHKIFGNYGVFQDNSMANHTSMSLHQLSIGDFFSTKELKLVKGLHVGINLAVLLFAVAAIFQNPFWKKEKKKEILFSSIFIILLSMFVASKLFPWDKVPSFLTMIQFPWRMSIFITFSISFIAGFALFSFSKSQQKMAMIFAIIIIVVLAMNSVYTDAITYPNLPSDMYEVGMGAQHEYLPVNTLKDETYLKNRDHKIHVTKGKAKVSISSNKVPYLKANIKLKTNSATLELPRLYYLGYEIQFITDDGKKQLLKYSENKKGFIEVKVKDSGTMIVDYKGTTLGKISNVISIISVISFGGWMIIKRKYQK